jgi:hypothetical protein
VDFYPSISEKRLNEALAENDISIIKHARKSLLFGNGKLWTKKDGISTALKFVSWWAFSF